MNVPVLCCREEGTLPKIAEDEREMGRVPQFAEVVDEIAAAGDGARSARPMPDRVK
jgi:hypothetical protein